MATTISPLGRQVLAATDAEPSTASEVGSRVAELFAWQGAEPDAKLIYSTLERLERGGLVARSRPSGGSWRWTITTDGAALLADAR